MLSQTSEYALRAAVYLADREGQKRLVPVAEIAKALDVPANYLSKILYLLTRNGVFASVRGPHGGFRLAIAAEQLPLDRIISVFDRIAGEERHCVLGRPECSESDPCGAHHRWRTVAAGVQQFFGKTTVADLLANGGLGRSSALKR